MLPVNRPYLFAAILIDYLLLLIAISNLKLGNAQHFGFNTEPMLELMNDYDPYDLQKQIFDRRDLTEKTKVWVENVKVAILLMS